jgi:hypothetical protein
MRRRGFRYSTRGATERFLQSDNRGVSHDHSKRHLRVVNRNRRICGALHILGYAESRNMQNCRRGSLVLTAMSAPIAQHIQAPRSEAISLSGARNRPFLVRAAQRRSLHPAFLLGPPASKFRSSGCLHGRARARLCGYPRCLQHHHRGAVPQAVRRDVPLLKHGISFGGRLNVFVENVLEAGSS